MGSSEVEQANENPFIAPDPPEDPPKDPSEDAPDAPEPDAEPEPEPAPQGPTEKEIEARYKAVERAVKTYVRRVEMVFEDDFKQFLGCPLCAGDFPGFIHAGKVGGFPREIVSGTNEIMTGFKQVEYQQLPGFETCPTCAGEGKGYTGSKVPDKAFADCPTCKARGYVAPGIEQANGHAPDAVQHFTAPDEAPYNAGDEPDEWDEPKYLPDGRENPNHGKMPHRKVLVEPWGITAGLGKRVEA